MGKANIPQELPLWLRAEVKLWVLWVESCTVEIRYLSLFGYLTSRSQVCINLLNMDTGHEQSRFFCRKTNLVLIIGHFIQNYKQMCPRLKCLEKILLLTAWIIPSVCILKSRSKKIAGLTSQNLSVLVPNLSGVWWCENEPRAKDYIGNMLVAMHAMCQRSSVTSCAVYIFLLSVLSIHKDRLALLEGPKKRGRNEKERAI